MTDMGSLGAIENCDEYNWNDWIEGRVGTNYSMGIGD